MVYYIHPKGKEVNGWANMKKGKPSGDNLDRIYKISVTVSALLEIIKTLKDILEG